MSYLWTLSAERAGGEYVC